MDCDEGDDELPDFAAMHLDEMEELLRELELPLTDEELHQVAIFAGQSGSLQAALEALSQLEREAA